MRGKLAYCHGVNQADVEHVAKQFKPWKLARHYGVPTETMKAWLSGEAEMPLMLYELLSFKVRCVLPETAGLFAGWRIRGGDRFCAPGDKGGLHWMDIDQIKDYRRATNVASRQCDLIERLTKERDFYKRQCELETRYGVMLRQMITGRTKRRGGGFTGQIEV